MSIPFQRFADLSLLAAAVVALAACGGGGDDSSSAPASAPAPAPAPAPAASPAPAPATAPAPAPAPTASISGIAAIGAPLAGATVSATCARGPAVTPATTTSTGTFTLTVQADALPCALEARGGLAAGAANAVVLHSRATAAGIVNMTPLTDLAIARAAALTSTQWFANLATAPAGTALDTRAAIAELLAGLAAGNYTLPAGAFDPFTTPFVAQAGNAYDGLLDALAASLAAAARPYADLVAQAASAAPNAFELPPVTVIRTPYQTVPIILKAKYNVVAADVAPLAGTYAGTLGRIFTPGQPTVETSSCSISVGTDGLLTVRAGDRSLAASVNGDVGDVIIDVVGLQRLQASDVANDRYAQLTTVRGFMAQGVARQGGFGFSDATNRVECLLPDPVGAAAGATTVQTLNGATAREMASSFVGTYANASCTLSVSATGVMRLKTATVDVSATLGGDENDTVVVFPGIATVLQGQEYRGAGVEEMVALSHSEGNAGLGIAPSFSGEASHQEPRPRSKLAQCDQLVKQ